MPLAVERTQQTQIESEPLQHLLLPISQADRAIVRYQQTKNEVETNTNRIVKQHFADLKGHAQRIDVLGREILSSLFDFKRMVLEIGTTSQVIAKDIMLYGVDVISARDSAIVKDAIANEVPKAKEKLLSDMAIITKHVDRSTREFGMHPSEPEIVAIKHFAERCEEIRDPNILVSIDWALTLTSILKPFDTAWGAYIRKLDAMAEENVDADGSYKKKYREKADQMIVKTMAKTVSSISADEFGRSATPSQLAAQIACYVHHFQNGNEPEANRFADILRKRTLVRIEEKVQVLLADKELTNAQVDALRRGLFTTFADWGRHASRPAEVKVDAISESAKALLPYVDAPKPRKEIASQVSAASVAATQSQLTDAFACEEFATKVLRHNPNLFVMAEKKPMEFFKYVDEVRILAVTILPRSQHPVKACEVSSSEALAKKCAEIQKYAQENSVKQKLARDDLQYENTMTILRQAVGSPFDILGGITTADAMTIASRVNNRCHQKDLLSRMLIVKQMIASKMIVVEDGVVKLNDAPYQAGDPPKRESLRLALGLIIAEKQAADARFSAKAKV